MTFEIEQSAQTRGWPIRAEWWLMPLWSALAGIWAFSRTALNDSPTQVAIAIALVAGGWQPFWLAATRTVWAGPLSHWKNWKRTLPIPEWPYMQPGTAGALLHERLALARSWWRYIGRQTLMQPLRRGILACLISLLLGAALGRLALLLSLGVMALAELAALWHDGKGRVGTLWSATALVGMPWLLGASLSNEGGHGVLAAIVVTLMAGTYARKGAWSILGPILGAVFLVWQGQPLIAGWLLLSALPGLVVLAQRPEEEVYTSVAGLSILAMVGLVAVAL